MSYRRPCLLEMPMKNITDVACEAGTAAFSRFCRWSNTTESKLPHGSEFIFHYELADHLWRYRAALNLARLDFDRALVEVCARDGKYPARNAVSRNTRRRFIVMHQHSGEKIVIRAQQFHGRGIIVAEAKGLVRAFVNYNSFTSAALVGLAAWEDGVCPKEFLAHTCSILSREFTGFIGVAFSPLDAGNDIPFVFAFALRRNTAC